MTAVHNPKPTTHNSSPVPRLDLAPKRKKPLSLWNPLDYLTLLYWAFFFPQAIRWYVETFGLPEYQKKTGREVWQVLLYDRTQRRLVIQALLTLLLAVFAIMIPLNLPSYDILILGFFLAATILPSVSFGVQGSILDGVPRGVVDALVSGITWSVYNGVIVSVTIGMTFDATGSIRLVVSFGVFLGLMLGARWIVKVGVTCGVTSGITRGVAWAVVSAVVFGVFSSVIFGVVFGLEFSVIGGLASSMAVGIAAGVGGGRALEWLLAGLFWRCYYAPPPGTQLAWLPLPGYQHRIEDWLESDWQAGVHNVNELLTFTAQFVPVVEAVNAALARLPEERLLSLVGILADNPFDWYLLRSCSVSLHNQLWQNFSTGLLIVPRKWREQRFPAECRLDTPARAACAGFWYWHKQEADKAAAAFAVVKDISHGTEIYGIAQAIVAGQQVETLQDLATVGQTVSLPLGQANSLPYGALRPGTLRTLRILTDVSAEASTAHHALAPLNRSAALGRANAALTNLLETGVDFCPEPEWPLIEEIARKWRDIVSKAGGVIGEEVLRQPVLNPYEGSSGLPVTGHTFVGRKAIITQIERHWASTGTLPPLILYGHRRMGKSSILRNLDKGLPPGNLLVYLDMQNSSFVNHTGELLLDMAEAIYHVTHTVIPSEARNLSPAEGRPFASLRVTEPTSADYTTLGSARRALNALLEELAPQMQDRRLILAIDEFEIIQDGIDAGRIDPDVLKYLRSRIQEYHWLALIFAGLHTLDELGRDYKSVFYGQAEHIRVSYLGEADALDLIARPHPDFALEYAPELRAELYRLTYGQPYLLQRLCWELVERWNERFLREGESTPRELALDELPPILTPDFYHAAGYYFDGVWNNITEDERVLLRVMAGRESPWMRSELVAALLALNLDAVFELLRRHDIVLEETAGIRFASELLRRWIVQFSTD